MLGRQAVHALKALLELAEAPRRWRSVRELADHLELPAPMLEQLLLRLRRAGLLEARRGRWGGYRLARSAEAIPLAEVLAAVGRAPSTAPPVMPDLAVPSSSESGPASPAAVRAAEVGDRVTALLAARLRSALERELERCTLAELLFDLRSARAVLSEEGGLLLG